MEIICPVIPPAARLQMDMMMMMIEMLDWHVSAAYLNKQSLLASPQLHLCFSCFTRIWIIELPKKH